MSDLISRQAAIEVIDSVFPVDPTKSEFARGIACGAALAKTYIEQLPSAQPEIIRCKDCKWFDISEMSGTVEPISYRCKLKNKFVDTDDFCKRGEGREEE